ncbi:MAG: ribbon-helix-helix domain-containing protein [Pseudomonadota bacterium]
MRTLIDIPDNQIKELTVICQAENLSCSEAIRQAIASYLEQKKSKSDDAFGLWKEHPVDGLVYQERMRSEW